MMIWTVGGKDYTIKFTYGAVASSKLVSDFINKITQDGVESIDGILEIIPKMLLVGLQKVHKEFKCDFTKAESIEPKMKKVIELLETYFDEDDGDMMQLYQELSEDMSNESFLSSMFKAIMDAENKSE